MAYGNISEAFRDNEATMGITAIGPSNEKMELSTVFRQEAVVDFNSKIAVAPVAQVPEKPAVNPAITEDVALAGNSLRSVSGVAPKSGGVISGVKEIGTEIGKDMGELGQSLFNLFGSKPETPQVSDPNMQLAVAPPQQRFSTFGL